MKLFACQHCNHLVYFENVTCAKCGYALGYLPDLEDMSAVLPDGPYWLALAAPQRRFRFCQNWELRACNWLVDATLGQELCMACRHNQTVPDVSDPLRLQQWVKIEDAKRRLIYSLLKFGLPLLAAGDGSRESLVFQFLAEMPDRKKIMTGHENGLITIALKEADDSEREKLRNKIGETYRTLIGHFRHEVGHYYWDLLVRDGDRLGEFRTVFGDERQDYSQALSRHYQTGPPLNWQDDFVSAYASMHPWEDFAETWAHYFHIVDTLEIAYAFGISVAARTATDEDIAASVDRNPYNATTLESLVSAWVPLSLALNSMNRGMGQPDLYPFVLTPPALKKLGYVHELIRVCDVRGRIKHKEL